MALRMTRIRQFEIQNQKFWGRGHSPPRKSFGGARPWTPPFASPGSATGNYIFWKFTRIPKMNFLGQGFKKLQHSRQTDPPSSINASDVGRPVEIPTRCLLWNAIDVIKTKCGCSEIILRQITSDRRCIVTTGRFCVFKRQPGARRANSKHAACD